MYRFEWNYDGINNSNDFENLVAEIRDRKDGVNYEQLARLFYHPDNSEDTVMIELQVPTKEMEESTDEKENPWVDAYKVKDMDDYNASEEIDSSIGCGVVFTFYNAETEMLKYAKSMFE